MSLVVVPWGPVNIPLLCLCVVLPTVLKVWCGRQILLWILSIVGCVLLSRCRGRFWTACMSRAMLLLASLLFCAVVMMSCLCLQCRSTVSLLTPGLIENGTWLALMILVTCRMKVLILVQ